MGSGFVVKACRTLRDKLANQKVTGALDGLGSRVYKGLIIDYLGSCASGLFQRLFLNTVQERGTLTNKGTYHMVMFWTGVFSTNTTCYLD